MELRAMTSQSITRRARTYDPRLIVAATAHASASPSLPSGQPTGLPVQRLFPDAIGHLSRLQQVAPAPHQDDVTILDDVAAI
jgi:hypothetical protein